MTASASTNGRASDRARVRDAMSWPALSLQVDHEINAGLALRLAAENAVHHLIVLNSAELVGIVCTCDLVQASPGSLVETLMTTKVVTVRDATRLWRAVARMDDYHVNCLPTLSHGAWGVLTRGDLERAGACERHHCFACRACHHLHAHPFYEAQWFCPDCLPAHDEFACWYDDHGGGD